MKTSAFERAKSSVEITTPAKIRIPPIVGVPFFAACRSASFPTSSFVLKLCPNFILWRMSIAFGANAMAMKKATAIAHTHLNDRYLNSRRGPKYDSKSARYTSI